MDYTLLVNDEYTYPLLNHTMYDRNGDWSLIIQADDFAELKRNFSDITNLKILRGNTVISETNKYDKYSGISLGDELYDHETGNYYTTFRVTLRAANIIAQIENISRQLNTNINYETISLDDYKKYKINQSKEALADYLESHPLLSSVHNNTVAYYSVTKEKQDLMMQQYLSYQIAKSVDQENATLTYNATGEVCEPWSEAEFLQLIIEVKSYVYPLVSYQQTVEKKIMECETKDEVSNITIDYASAVEKAAE